MKFFPNPDTKQKIDTERRVRITPLRSGGLTLSQSVFQVRGNAYRRLGRATDLCLKLVQFSRKGHFSGYLIEIPRNRIPMDKAIQVKFNPELRSITGLNGGWVSMASGLQVTEADYLWASKTEGLWIFSAPRRIKRP